MKRIACFLLVALMLVAGSASAGEKDYAAMLEEQKAEGLLHLWDIPFGITMDEFMVLAEEKAGLPFEVFPDDAGKPRECSIYDGMDAGGCEYSVEGYAVERIIARFYNTYSMENGFLYNDTDVEGLREIEIKWLMDGDEDEQQRSEKYAGVLLKLVQKFGKYEEYLFLNANEDKGQEDTLIDQDGALNIPNLVESMKQEKLMLANFFWKNAKYEIECGKQTDLFFYLTITDKALEE